ncbi:MAG: hypothetical protein WCL51_14140 [Bacteroidota bacterium]
MKINKHVLTLLFTLLLSGITFSQNTSFSKVISPYGNINYASFAASGIVKQDNKYILALSGYDTTNISTDIQSLYFAKVDSNGDNFEIIKKYNQSDTNYYTNFGALIKTHNGGFCFVGDIDFNYNNKLQHYVMLFDSSMNNILTKIIPHDTIWEAVRQITETHDQGFILVGCRYVSDIVGNVLLIKTDSLGNQLWKMTISTGGYIGNGKQIEETPDHGFLICGYNGSYTTGQGGPFLIKTDSAGNLIWVKYLGNSSQQDGSAAMAITQEGDYLVAFGYTTYTYTDNQYWSGRLNVIKYSPDGTQIWNKMYDTIRENIIVNKIQILPNNDFIVMGSCVENEVVFYYTSFIFKFKSNSDSLWRKIYYYTKKFTDGNYLVDNILNSDGSITACGYVNGDTLVPYEKIWILKTDSSGYAPGCEPTVINEIQYAKTEAIRVYPNPATNQTTIAYLQLKEEGTIHTI